MMKYAAGLFKCEKKKRIKSNSHKDRKTMIMEIPQLDVDRLHIPKGGPSPWTFPKK